MEVFETSISFDVPSSVVKLLSRVSNPVLFSAVTAHILPLKAYSQQANDFVPLSALTSPSDRFRVIYALGLCDEEIHLSRGYLEKAGQTQVGLIYRGRTDDRRFNWEAVLEMLPVNDEKVRIQVLVTARYAIPRLAGLGPGKLDVPKFIEHILRDHVEPYFRLYYTGLTARSLNVEVTAVHSAEGPLSDVLLQIWNHIENLGLGIVKFEGENIRGILSVKDGKIKDVRLFYNGKTLWNDEAIAKIMELSSPVKVSMYAVDTESLMEAVMGHTIGGKTTSS